MCPLVGNSPALSGRVRSMPRDRSSAPTRSSGPNPRPADSFDHELGSFVEDVVTALGRHAEARVYHGGQPAPGLLPTKTLPTRRAESWRYCRPPEWLAVQQGGQRHRRWELHSNDLAYERDVGALAGCFGLAKARKWTTSGCPARSAQPALASPWAPALASVRSAASATASREISQCEAS